MTQAAKNTLMKFKNQIKWGSETKMPFGPGEAINTVIQAYKIPAIKWGWDGSLIGVETKKQFMFWRDNGASLEFKGLLNKEELNASAEKPVAKKKTGCKSKKC
jgi:hypothetical protein